MAIFLSLLFFEVSTMPYGDYSLSKRLDDGGHRPLNSVAPTTSMAVVKTRVLRFSRLRIRERGMRELPQSRRHALTMTRREAETCQSFLDVFPAVPSKRLSGFHGKSNSFAYSHRFGLADTARCRGRMKNGAERLFKPFTGCLSFRAAVIGCHLIFALRKGQIRFLRVY